MSQSDDTSATYDVDAARIAELYESMSSTIIHAQLAEFIPVGPGLALDVDGGSGRDAAWLTSLGYHLSPRDLRLACDGRAGPVTRSLR